MKKDLKYYEKLPYRIILERWDDDDSPYWVARVAELPHCMIHGDTPEEAIQEIQEVKRDWLKSNLERGIPIPEPEVFECSGQIRLRIPPSLHRQLRYRAIIEDVSLNQLMTSILASSAGVKEHSPKKAGGRASIRVRNLGGRAVLKLKGVKKVSGVHILRPARKTSRLVEEAYS